MLVCFTDFRDILESKIVKQGNTKEPGVSSLYRDLPGVGSMTAPHMEHRAKPLLSFLSTPCFCLKKETSMTAGSRVASFFMKAT